MKSFKTFITEELLTEASAKHFAHLNLDANNPEHKDLIDAYNAGHSSNDPNVPRHPGQVKSIDQLKDAVKPHLEKIQAKRANDAEDRQAFESGSAHLIHHNRETGLKVFQAHDQHGSVAALNACNNSTGDGHAPWCTGQRTRSHDMVRNYDKGGNHSFIISDPKHKNPEMRLIGAYGKFSGESGLGGNFQGTGNSTTPEEDWNEHIKTHGLDKIKHLQGSIRNIPLHAADKTKYEHELTHNIANNTVSTADIAHAQEHGYLRDHHVNAMLDNPHTKPEHLNKLVSHMPDKSDVNAYLRKQELQKKVVSHPNVNASTLSNIAKDTHSPSIHDTILKNDNADSHTVAEVAKKSTLPGIHDAILTHPKADDEAFSHLAKHHMDDVDQTFMNKLQTNLRVGTKTLSTLAQNPKYHDFIMNHPHRTDEALANVEYHGGQDTHKDLLKNTATGGETLKNMAITAKPELHDEILAHPKVNDKTLSNLIESSPNNRELQQKIINHHAVGADALHQIMLNSNHDDEETHDRIVAHPKTSDRTLAKIAHRYPEKAEAIMKHPNVGPMALGTLADKSDKLSVHRALLKHPATDSSVLERMAGKSSTLHPEIMEHKHADDATLEEVAKRAGDDVDIQHKLLEHKKSGNRTLTRLAYVTTDHGVRRAIASNPKSGDSALSELLNGTDASNSMHSTILKHPNVGFHTFGKIMKYGTDKDRIAIAKHPNADHATLNNLVMSSKSRNMPEIHTAIAKHPNADSRDLEKVARRTDDPKIHKLLLKHPNSDSRVNQSIIDISNDASVHAIVAKHPETSILQGETLARMYGLDSPKSRGDSVRMYPEDAERISKGITKAHKAGQQKTFEDFKEYLTDNRTINENI